MFASEYHIVLLVLCVGGYGTVGFCMGRAFR